MPIVENIVNGDFQLGSTGWGGTDMETNSTNSAWNENTYLGSGNTSNFVAEMDGHTGQTTVMEQTFTVDGPITTDVTFDAALRSTGVGGTSGVDGFTIEVLDSSGSVIATMDVLPTTNTLTGYTLPVTFPDAGDYTLRLTELGDDNSIGVVVDDVSLLTCFTRGTMIETANGEKLIEELQTGDLVRTMDHGFQPIRWVGSSKRAAYGEMAPILIRKGALGNTRDLMVSPQHRMLLSGWQAELLFGTAQMLASARSLINDQTVLRVEGGEVEYFHILFEQHEIIFAEGAPSESFQPDAKVIAGIDQAARDEILALFPHLAKEGAIFGADARSSLEAYEGTIFATISC